jgi:hypothetical protein
LALIWVHCKKIISYKFEVLVKEKCERGSKIHETPLFTVSIIRKIFDSGVNSHNISEEGGGGRRNCLNVSLPAAWFRGNIIPGQEHVKWRINGEICQTEHD